jgi:hypothetical protein
MAKRIPQTAKILRAARRLLVTKGWIKGAESTSEGYCAMGAVSHTTGFPYYDKERALAVLAQSVRGHHAYGNRRTISDYNDAKTRRKAQVIALFDRAIERASRK